jgi:PhnB protein
MAMKPVPDGYHTVTPYLIVEGASLLIEFLKEAFDAQGTIMHAEVRIGDSVVMLSDVMGVRKPMPTAIYLYVNGVDAIYQRAPGGSYPSDGAC